MKKVLISAFKPFANLNNNYSKEVLMCIDTKDFHIDKVTLDVVYDKSYEDLKTIFDLSSYDLIIALGEARIRNVLTVEHCGKNISSCSLKDNENNLKINEIIDENEKEKLFTTLDLNKVIHIAEISEDAGKFVCNNLYFHLLKDYPNKSLFIHIPECQNDINMYKKYAHDIIEIIKCLI